VPGGKWDYLVVGAGPAGAALAWRLGRAGFRVLVAEALPRPGMKPCGRGIPDAGDLPFRVPGECVVRRIRGARLYVDNREAFNIEGSLEGYIVDRSCLAEALISEGGAELVTRAFYNKRRSFIRIGGHLLDARRDRTIIAGGHPYYPGEKIEAVQVLLPGDWPDRLDIFFDIELIGYYWVFPSTPGLVEIGVGGFAPMARLRELLNGFLRRHPAAEPFHGKEPVKLEGARIAVGGVWRRGLEEWPLHIGEAAGFVYPLTGEGIRPSMLSAVRLGDALASRNSPSSILRGEPARGITLQRRILEAVKSMSPPERASLLTSIPGSLHVKVALGRAGWRDLARALVRRPRLLAKIARFIRAGGGDHGGGV